MSNLITEKQKKKLTNDYLIRLLTVALFLASLLGVFLLAYVIPYYISVNKKNLKVSEQFEGAITLENKENVGESVTKIVSETVEKMKVIELYEKKFYPSNYFTKILNNKDNSISINKLSFSILKNNQISFLVSGISKDREGLVAFVDRLKSQPDFESVDFPISDLAQDHNINFTLNIITKI